MEQLTKILSNGLFILVWVSGWVLAKGFWSTLFAIIIPPWGWYLVAEQMFKHFGII